MSRLWMVLALGGVSLLLASSSAHAQYRTTAYPSGYSPYSAPGYTPSPVSPYLNMGVTPDGLSNYQTLVRPMIDERDELLRQSSDLQQLQRQVQPGGRIDPRIRAAQARPATTGRYMNYSHYYGGIR